MLRRRNQSSAFTDSLYPELPTLARCIGECDIDSPVAHTNNAGVIKINEKSIEVVKAQAEAVTQRAVLEAEADRIRTEIAELDAEIRRAASKPETRFAMRP